MRNRRKLISFILCLALLIGMPISAYSSSEDLEGINKQFTDMPENWSTDALKNAVENGLLTGADGKIMPNAPLTRAQLAAIIVRAFGAATKGDIKAFADVQTNKWYADDLAKAYQMGVLNGSDGLMYPNKSITRQEVFSVVARAFKLQPADTVSRNFTDVSQISSWAKGNIYALVNNGYLEGTNGRLNPKDTITRAEFAQFMDNILKQYIGKPGEATTVAKGNIMINVPGVTLKNLTVQGDLIIGDGVGNGEVILDNVKVTGRLVARGGGENSIIIRGTSDVSNVIVARIDGAVSVKVQGDANVEVIYIDDGSDDVNIQGTVGNVEIKAQDIVVSAVGAQIQKIDITAENSKVIVDSKSKVNTVKIEEKAANSKIEVAGAVASITTAAPSTQVTGKGEVTKVEAQAGANQTKVETPKTQIVVGSGVSGVSGAGGTQIKENTTAKNNDQGTSVEGQQQNAAGGTSGSGNPGSSSVAVTGITVLGTGNATIIINGAALQMLATVLPANATNKTVTWSVTTGSGAATIEASTGLLTGTALGTVTVTAVNAASGISGSCMITVVTALEAAKVNAKSDLATALAGYLPASYTTVNWTALNTAKTDGDSAIDAATDLTGVTNAKTAALTSMADVQTIAQTLASAKTAAKGELSTALGTYTQSDYTAANWTVLNTAKTNGDSAIDAATDVSGITNAKTAALASMAGIQTIAQTLTLAKTAAKGDLTTALGTYTQSDYTASNWTALNTAKTDGDSAIDVATDVSGVANAKTAALASMAGIQTITQTLTLAKAAAKGDLATAFGTYTQSDYTTANWTALNTAKTNGDSAIDASTDVSGVTNAKAAALASMAGIQTIAQTLTSAKTAAKSDLMTALGTYTQSDYTASNWAALNTAKTDGDSAIDVATDVSGVTNAKTAALASMAGIQTIAQALASAKTAAKGDLNTALGTYTQSDYTAANWTALNTAKTDGDSAIDIATDVTGVTNAKTVALASMAGIQTIAQTLASAKTSAKGDLNTALGTYTQSDYTAANWTALNTAKIDGDGAIDTATDVTGVTNAKTAALASMAGIQTIAQTLASAKTSAKGDLTTALGTYTQSDYTAANWTALNTAKTDGDSAIEAATDLTGVTNARTAALASMAGIQTIAQTLASAKTAAKGDLTTALGTYTQSDYTAANWTALNTAKTDGDSAIDAATDVTAVTNAKMEALASMAGIQTIAQTLAPAKTAAKGDLNTALGTYTQTDYTADNWTALNTAKTDGDSAIDAAMDLNSITNAKTAALTSMAAIQTIAQTLALAKNTAKGDLTTVLGTYTQADYTVVNWTALNTAKTDGDSAIDAATDLTGVTNAKIAALASMAGIQTTAQMVAAAKTAINAANYSNLAVLNLADQTQKTAAVQTVVTAAVNNASISAIVTLNGTTSAYDVAISLNGVNDSTSITTATFVRLSITPNGDLVDSDSGASFIGVIYTKVDGKLYFNTADTNGEWGAETLLGAVSQGRMDIDSSGNVHVVYTTGSCIGYRMFDGAAWSTEKSIASKNGGSCSLPDVAADGNGYAHITYMDTLGNVGDYTDAPDVMYATNKTGSFVITMIAKGYYDYYGGASGHAEYYENGSRITANAGGDYFIGMRQHVIDRAPQWTDHVYYTRVVSNLGSGSIGGNSGDNVFDMTNDGGKITILYCNGSVMKTSVLTANAGAVSFGNTVTVDSSDAHSVAVNGTDTVVGGKAAAYALKINYNGFAHVYADTTKTDTRVDVVYFNGKFRVLFADNADGLVKIKEVENPWSTVTQAAIEGVTAPVRGETPVTTITENSQYTGTVSWSPAHDPFEASTVYTATITLTAKSGYQFSGVAQNFFTVNGASATNSANSSTVTAVFPITGAAPLTDTQKVAADLGALTESAIKGSNTDLSNVMYPLNLITTGTAQGLTIGWGTNDEFYVNSSGIVRRPYSSDPDVTATLTAIATSGAVSDSREFTVTVKKMSAEENAAVDAVNASSVANMGTIINANAAVLELDLTGYNSLANKDYVHNAIYQKWFSDTNAVKAAFDAAVAAAAADAEAVAAVNAATADQMAGVLSTYHAALGLDLTDYNLLTDKSSVHSALTGKSFANGTAVKAAFNAAVATQKVAEDPLPVEVTYGASAMDHASLVGRIKLHMEYAIVTPEAVKANATYYYPIVAIAGDPQFDTQQQKLNAIASVAYKDRYGMPIPPTDEDGIVDVVLDAKSGNVNYDVLVIYYDSAEHGKAIGYQLIEDVALND